MKTPQNQQTKPACFLPKEQAKQTYKTKHGM